MEHNKMIQFYDSFIKDIEKLIPSYLENPEDSFSNGNVAVCIIDSDGMVFGHIGGNDKIVGRQFFKNACIKATQVWITGMKTGEFEKRLYNEEFAEEDYGISKPNLIGWEGGQPFSLKDGSKISIGFSGFRGINDLEIVTRAINNNKFIS